MRRYCLLPRLAAPCAALAVICALSLVVAAPQVKTSQAPPPPTPPREKTEPKTMDLASAEAAISKMLAEYDLKPRPLPAIPDNPPPHEGAMIILPTVVEPGDLMLVEVLDALPGRPISGERLVRPDGKVSLGFYGEVEVKGLTLDQIKVAIIRQLRKYLADDALGLRWPEEEAENPPAPGVHTQSPEVPKGGKKAVEGKEEKKTRRSSGQSRPDAHPARKRSALRRAVRSPAPYRVVSSSPARSTTQDQQGPQQEGRPFKNDDERKGRKQEASPFTIDADGKGRITITIDLDRQAQGPIGIPQLQGQPQPQPQPGTEQQDSWIIVPPAESTTVLVDVTAYNTRNFYVQGDVLITGKLPWTGHETVLDALNYAGGLLPSGEPKDIRLVRPGLDGKPARVYKVDLAAIQEKGDVTANYQIFPNDRLIVGRSEVVKRTVELDRLTAPIQTVIGSMLQNAYMLRALQIADPDHGNELLKDLVEFWAKQLARKGDVKFEEETLREALLRHLKAMPAPKSGPGAR